MFVCLPGAAADPPQAAALSLLLVRSLRAALVDGHAAAAAAGATAQTDPKSDVYDLRHEKTDKGSGTRAGATPSAVTSLLTFLTTASEALSLLVPLAKVKHAHVLPDGSHRHRRRLRLMNTAAGAVKRVQTPTTIRIFPLTSPPPSPPPRSLPL